jgi:hypothetical protein
MKTHQWIALGVVTFSIGYGCVSMIWKGLMGAEQAPKTYGAADVLGACVLLVILAAMWL